MQLQSDVWANILRCLPRGSLDDLVILDRTTNGFIRSMSEPSRIGPLRTILLEVFENAHIRQQHIYVAPCSWAHDKPDEEALHIGYRMRCTTSARLFRVMKDSVVRNLWLYYLDENSFAAIAPHVHRWRSGGQIHRTPRRFPNGELFRRFFHELLFTSGTITLEMPMTFQFDFDPARFWNFEAVRRCQSLKVNRLFRAHRWQPLSSEQIIAWLSTPTTGLGRRMELDASVLTRNPSRFIDDLIAHFLMDSAPKTYSVKIVTLYARNRSGLHLNSVTREELHVTADAISMNIERKTKI